MNRILEFWKWLIDDVKTTLFYRFGIGGTEMPPDMLEEIRKQERQYEEIKKGKRRITWTY